MVSPMRSTGQHGRPSGSGAGEATSHGIDAGSRRQYQEYCQRQAEGLVRLVPKEAIRPLYCRELLPLPPFECWLEDYEHNRIAHLQYVSEGPLDTRTVAPVVVDASDLRIDGETWTASLSLFPDGDVWRGFIGFRRGSSDTGVRTANVFCEEDPKNIRERFTDLTSHTLKAFLRSTLP